MLPKIGDTRLMLLVNWVYFLCQPNLQTNIALQKAFLLYSDVF